MVWITVIPTSFRPGLRTHYCKFDKHVGQQERMSCQSMRLFKEVPIPFFWPDSYPNRFWILLQAVLLG